MSADQAVIACAFQSINQKQKDLIELAYFRGYSQYELAGHFNIPLETVKSRMRAAMLLLRDSLKHLS